MSQKPLSILQINTTDKTGGAAQVAWMLHESFKKHGLNSWLAVGYQKSEDTQVVTLPNRETSGLWGRYWASIANKISQKEIKSPFEQFLLSQSERLVNPIRSLMRYWDYQQGRENFRFPGIWKISRLLPDGPDVILTHNLHGGYFDLRALPFLSRQAPLILCLSDAWLLSGHCAHSLGCERWKIGCGRCPNLTIYPAVQRDNTANNWRRKRRIYTQSHFYIITPAHWLMAKVDQSMLADSVLKSQVIPHGVDLSIYQPGEQSSARAILDLPQDAWVVAFAGKSTRENPFKDFDTVFQAIKTAAENFKGRRIIFLSLGSNGKSSSEMAGSLEIRHVPYVSNPTQLATYYQAMDVYLHAAPIEGETFGLTIAEAKACGVPVIGTATGGISEQIIDGENGFLTPPGDAPTMAQRLITLLNDETLRNAMKEQAVSDARQRFDLTRMAADYLNFIQLVVEDWATKRW